jgi:hypothetical protein
MLAVYILRSHLQDLKKEYSKAISDPSQFDEAKKLLVEIKHVEKVIARRISMYQNPN